jgi:hypothetical protein
MIETVGDQPQRERLYSGSCELSGSTVCSYAGKGRNLREPTAVFLAIVLDGQWVPIRGGDCQHAFMTLSNSGEGKRLTARFGLVARDAESMTRSEIVVAEFW